MENSEAKWRQALGGKVLSIPAAQAESVVMVTDDGMLRCYSYAGRLLWQFDAQGKLTPFVSRSQEGTSYICKIDGTLMAINRSGRLLWTKKLSDPLAATPLIGWDGRIFIPQEQEVLCISAAGDQRWILKLDAPLALPPVQDSKGGILIALKSGQVLNISAIGDIQSITVKEAPAVLVDFSESVGIGPGVIVYYRNGNGEIIPFSGPSKPLPSISGLPIAAGRHGSQLAILLESGSLVSISLETMQIIWQGTGPVKSNSENMAFPLSGKTNTRPSILFDERGIYALRLSGAAGFTADGRRLWSIAIQGAASSPSFSDEGILYSGGNDWILYAYKLEDRVRLVSRSLYGPAPDGTYQFEKRADPQIVSDPFFFEETNIIRILSQIESLLNKGTVGPEEPASLLMLMHIASGGMHSSSIPFRLQPLVQANYRVWAIQLLARLGSRETIPFFTNLARNEQDSLIVSEIAAAIGHIGVDPEGLALAVYERIMHSGQYRQDERVLTAIAQSIGALCRFSGPPLSSAGIPYLIKLSETDKPPVVRHNAQQALQRLLN
ncbi:PQQ-binding-like beta-propeller repeat protein [Gracilinema caldarium]|uniref:outer membrane protein assembly factor BamB family protein n=1 Tax=Gracilinema caldarium TaxID=215591 RepID=UPI0026ECE055|nr:PQQ-binding-like beta-propeller repeat protein [Gracilinema caldarium]